MNAVVVRDLLGLRFWFIHIWFCFVTAHFALDDSRFLIHLLAGGWLGFYTRSRFLIHLLRGWRLGHLCVHKVRDMARDCEGPIEGHKITCMRTVVVRDMVRDIYGERHGEGHIW